MADRRYAEIYNGINLNRSKSYTSEIRDLLFVIIIEDT